MTLSPLKFGQLWREHFEIFLPNQKLNSLYQSYLRRENDLEDYLDIFRGIDTRQIRSQNINVPHKFEEELVKGHIITYILIAEAAPPGNNYIYTDASGEYILAALKAFNVKNLDELSPIAKLEKLAEKGILILDLFPFNLDFNLKIRGAGITLRESLIAKHITSDFLINTKVIYSIINRVNCLRCEINNFLNHEAINTAFMATPKINNYLGALNFSGFFDLSKSPIKIQKGHNSFNQHVSIDHTWDRYSWTPRNENMEIINSYGSRYKVAPLSTSPFYTSSCNNGSGSPHEVLIKNALNL